MCSLDDRIALISAVALQAGPLGRIVGQQPHRCDAEIGEHLGTGAVLADVIGQAERQVGVHGVGALVLQLVGAELVQQADPAALVPADVEHDAATLGGHRVQGRVQLRSAVTAQRTQHVAGQALGVDPDQNVLAVTDVAVDQRDQLAVGDRADVADGAELALRQGKSGVGDLADLHLARAAVGDQVGDRDQRQPVPAGEHPQLGQPRHGAVVVDDLAQHAGRGEPGEHGQVHGGLGVAGPDQHAALACPQREHVAGPGQVVRCRRRVRQQLDRPGPFEGGDPGGDVVLGIHRDGEGRALAVLVDPVHRRQVEPLAIRPGQRHTDHARRVPDGECHQLWGGQLGGEDQIALVLPVLVVDDDDGAAGGDLGHRELDGVETARGLLPVRVPGRQITAGDVGRFDRNPRPPELVVDRLGRPGRGSVPVGGVRVDAGAGHALSRSLAASSRSTYLATTSTSRFTLVPTFVAPMVVADLVSGITPMPNSAPSSLSTTSITVSEMPSTAMAPLPARYRASSWPTAILISS